MGADAVRDLEYERHFLEQVVREAARRFGVNAAGYEIAVHRRLELGAARYGDGDFLHKDVTRELQEEAWDLGAYSVLEAQKSLALLEESDTRAHHLFEAALHGACADFHARLARAPD